MRTIISFANWCADNIGIDATRTPEQKEAMNQLGDYVIGLEREHEKLAEAVKHALRLMDSHNQSAFKRVNSEAIRIASKR